MALFDAHINALNNFRNDPGIHNITSEYEMLTRKEFTNWYIPPIRTRRQKANKSKNALQENIHLISNLLKDICKEGIGPLYLKGSISRVHPFREKGVTPSKSKFDNTTRFVRSDYGFDLTRDDYFDLLIAVRADVYKNQYATMEEKRNSVQSFLVTELGECKKKPNTMSVNLVCSRENTTLKSFFLLAAMMFCVKDSNYDQEIVLELAGKYTNIQGFKSYTRVGFDRDDYLFGSDCFEDIGNLPMSVDLNKVNTQEIISYVINKREIQKLDTTDKLAKHFYTLPIVKKDMAYEIGSVANYMHELDLDQEPKNDSQYKIIIRDAKTKQEKKDKLFERIEGLTPKNTPVQNQRRSRHSSSAKKKKKKKLLNTLQKKMEQKQSKIPAPAPARSLAPARGRPPASAPASAPKNPTRIPTPPMPVKSRKKRVRTSQARHTLKRGRTGRAD